jgi:hypothetical protein
MAWYAPLPLAAMGAVFLVLYLALRKSRFRVGWLLLPAVAFLLAAVEEWYMRTYQPEMNIRADALLFLGLVGVSLVIGVPMALTRRPHPAERSDIVAPD